MSELKIQLRHEHRISLLYLTLVDVLRLKGLRIPERRSSHPANLIRAVSTVDVETSDMDVEMRSRSLVML